MQMDAFLQLPDFIHFFIKSTQHNLKVRILICKFELEGVEAGKKRKSTPKYAFFVKKTFNVWRAKYDERDAGTIYTSCDTVHHISTCLFCFFVCKHLKLI
ncbi:hypothetical protein D9M72_590050 [compost metagenome]